MVSFRSDKAMFGAEAELRRSVCAVLERQRGIGAVWPRSNLGNGPPRSPFHFTVQRPCWAHLATRLPLECYSSGISLGWRDVHVASTHTTPDAAVLAGGGDSDCGRPHRGAERDNRRRQCRSSSRSGGSATTDGPYCQVGYPGQLHVHRAA